MTLDPEASVLLDAMRRAGIAAVEEVGADAARAASAAIKAAAPPGPAVHRVVDDVVGEGVERFRIRALVPSERPVATVLYLHGGGFVLGDIDGSDAFARELATASGATVVLAEYRKAPGHRYPAAVEDAWRALGWVDAHRGGLGGAALPLVVAGDSAGGNLALVTAVRARDRGGPALAGMILVYPVADAGLDTASMADPECQHVISRSTMRWFWDQYAPGPERFEPEASPARTPDLGRLPEALVVVAEHDPLRDEGIALAGLLRDAGVRVRLRHREGMIHGYVTNPAMRAGAEERRGIAAWIREIASRMAS